MAAAGAVTFVEPLANTVLHYFFDKYWDHPRAHALRARLGGGLGTGLARPPQPAA